MHDEVYSSDLKRLLYITKSNYYQKNKNKNEFKYIDFDFLSFHIGIAILN